MSNTVAIGRYAANRQRLLALVRHCDQEGIRFPPWANVAAALGCRTKRVGEYLEELCEEGTIYRAAPCCYRITEWGAHG